MDNLNIRLFCVHCFFIRLFGNAFIDDTYITLLYARNLSEHFEWGAYHGIPGNSASSPLNVILLAAINRLVENPEIVVLVLAILIQFLFFIVSCKIGEKLSLSKLFPFSISFIFLCNPLIISTMGLESMLLILIFFLTILFYLKDSVYNLGICIGLLYLTRPDAVLLALPFCIMRRGIKGRFLPPIIAFAIVSPWLYFSWKYMGSFFPDTLFIKKIEKSWGDFNFRNGWVLYYAKFPVEFAFSLSPLLLSAPFLFSLKKPFNKTFKIAILIGASGAIHYFAYSKLRVPPYHWYYAPSLFCLITAPTFLFFGNNPSKK